MDHIEELIMNLNNKDPFVRADVAKSLENYTYDERVKAALLMILKEEPIYFVKAIANKSYEKTLDSENNINIIRSMVNDESSDLDTEVSCLISIIEQLNHAESSIREKSKEYLSVYMQPLNQKILFCDLPFFNNGSNYHVDNSVLSVRKAAVETLKDKGVDLYYLTNPLYKKHVDNVIRRSYIKKSLISIAIIICITALLYLSVILFTDNGMARVLSSLKLLGISLLGVIIIPIGLAIHKYEVRWGAIIGAVVNPAGWLFCLVGIFTFIIAFIYSFMVLFEAANAPF